MLKRLGIVWGGESSGTEEFKEVIEAVFARPSRFVVRRQRPSVDDHVIGVRRQRLLEHRQHEVREGSAPI